MLSVYLLQAISSSIFSPTSFQDVFRKSYEDLVGMDSSDDLLAIISGKTAIIVEFFFRFSYCFSFTSTLSAPILIFIRLFLHFLALLFTVFVLSFLLLHILRVPVPPLFVFFVFGSSS